MIPQFPLQKILIWQKYRVYCQPTQIVLTTEYLWNHPQMLVGWFWKQMNIPILFCSLNSPFHGGLKAALLRDCSAEDLGVESLPECPYFLNFRYCPDFIPFLRCSHQSSLCILLIFTDIWFLYQQATMIHFISTSEPIYETVMMQDFKFY
jgi:hypothetical protein